MKKSIIASVVSSVLVFGAVTANAEEVLTPVDQRTDAEIQQIVEQNKAEEAAFAAQLEQAAKEKKVAMLARLSSKDAGILLDNDFSMERYKCSEFVHDVDVYEQDLAIDSTDMLKFMWLYGYTLGQRGLEYVHINDPEYVMVQLYDLCQESPESKLFETMSHVLNQKKAE